MSQLLRYLSRIGPLALALSLTAGPGYLPTVGPPPVRFALPPVPPSTDLEPLPPLVATDQPDPVAHAEPSVPDSPPEPAAESPEPPDSPESASAAMPPEPPPPSPGLSAPLPDHQSATNLVVPVVPGTEVPLAQLFLQYFGSRHGNTNGNGVGLLAPVGFVPPQPIIPPSSSASFKTTPAETP